MGCSLGQGVSPAQGQQVNQTLNFSAACKVHFPAEVTPLTSKDVDSSIVPSELASKVAFLSETWVTALEEQVQQKFTKFYNCQVAGREIPCELLQGSATPTAVSGEHALYFLPVSTAKDISHIFSGYSNNKLLYGQSSACFILPRRTAEWNSRVVHMHNIGALVDLSKQSIIDTEAVKHVQKMSSNQHMHNLHFAEQIVSSRMKWEVRHDPAEANDHLLTSHWHATIAGQSSQILIDTGAQENFLDETFLLEHQISYQKLSSPGNVQLGNGSVVPIKGKVTINLSIRNYHTKISMYVTELSPGINAVLGEPWLRAASAHIEYGPTGMSALKVWKGVKRYTLKPVIVQKTSEESPILSAMQCKKALRKAKGWFLVNVMHVMEEKPQPVQQSETAASASESAALPDKKKDRHRLISESRLQHLLAKYKRVFKDLPDGLPPDRGIQHTISLTEDKTPFKHPYRLSPKELEEAKRQIADLLAKGFIQPSQSPFGAPILFVQKKDGSLRMCIDYRALNAITSRNRYPLPNIADLLDRFTGATVFSSLDLASGYHQIRISEDDVPKTAFTTPFGHYEFKVLSFGLTNAPATFQAVMNRMFGHLHEFCVVYLDDILIFSKTPEEHEKHLDTVLQILEREGLYAKLKKCDFNKPELLYLGHIIGRDGIKVDPAKISCIKDWPKPKNVHELRSFLGLANYFRKFVMAYSIRTAPLTKLTGKNSKWDWTEDCQRAFEGLKVDLTTSPVLASPDMAKKFEVVADACGVGIGAVLLQEDRPLAFESKKLTGAETRYTTTEQELLASVHAMAIWRCFLEGLPKDQVTLVTDHHPNTCLPTQPNMNRRQARWSEFLQRFNFNWIYRPGRQNVADPVSRLPLAQQDCEPDEATDMVGVHSHHFGAVTLTSSSQRIDSLVWPPAAEILKGYTIDSSISSQACFTPGSEGLLYQDDRLVLPDALGIRQKVFHALHSTPFAGHKGIHATSKLIKRDFYWPNMDADIAAWIQVCPPCQRNKGRNQLPGGLLEPLPVPTRRWSDISLDFITHLPVTRQGHTAILVVVDRLSKLVHFVPTRDTASSEDVARLFIDNIFVHHGMPERIVSDRDSRFTGTFWQNMCDIWQVQRQLSTAYHPQTDGQTERVNRTLEDMLRHWCSPDQDDWDDHLKLAEFACNNATHASTGETPFMLTFGQHPLTPASLFRLDEHGKLRNPVANQFAAGMHDRIQKARMFLIGAQARQKSYADQGRRAVQFKIGQYVKLSTINLASRAKGTPKLHPKYIGPFQVLERIGPQAYKLLLPEEMRIHNVFHVSLLQAWHSSPSGPPPAQVLLVKDDEQFEVDSILDHQDEGSARRKKRSYLVSWKGYPMEDATWEPEAHLKNASSSIQMYWTARRQLG